MGKTKNSYELKLMRESGQIAASALKKALGGVQVGVSGLDLDKMTEYAEIFQYGAPPHGGAGFGLDRITHKLLGLDNIREAVLLPRDPERTRP